MRHRSLWRFSYCVLLAVSFSEELTAQTTTSGGLTGVVTDQSGAVVTNADVKIKDNTKGTNQSTKTDREGVYQFYFLAPNRYILTVVHDGFREVSRDVEVLLGPSVTLNVKLQIAKSTSEIRVSGEAPRIQAANGDFSATMNQQQISEVPNPGNDLTYIAQTTPGVVMNTEQGFGNFSILGMPGTSNLFTVNGMNDNDNTFNLNEIGPLGLMLGQNQIQEATVVSIGYSGQFGNAAGGNVNYITKSGNDGFHGNAQYYWNGRIFNANDWFNNALGNPRPFEIAHQWAVSLGGPIKKEKLFFFFDTEGLLLVTPFLEQVNIPSPLFETTTIANIDSDPRFGAGSATDSFYRRIFSLYDAAPGASSSQRNSFSGGNGCAGFMDPQSGLGVKQPCAYHFNKNVSDPSHDTVTSGRVDWNVGRGDRAFLQVQYGSGYVPFSIDPISSAFNVDEHSPWWLGQIIETHTLGSSGASQFLLAARYVAPISQLQHPSQAVSAFPMSLDFFAPDTFAPLAPYNSAYEFPNTTLRTQYQVSEDVVKTWRRHRFGAGANFQRVFWTNHGYTNDVLGTLTPLTLDAFYWGGVDPASSSTNYTQITQTFAARSSERILFYDLGIYVQDTWQVLPNVALTLALRGEHQANPVCKDRCFARMAAGLDVMSHDPAQPYDQAILANQKQALAATDNVRWSPRFSFAWQPRGVLHNIVLRGGIGIFSDQLPGLLAVSLSSNPPLLNQFTALGDNLAPNETTSLSKITAASNAAFVNGFKSGQTIAQIQAAVSAVNPLGFFPPSITAPERVLHSPQYQRWNLELQQALGNNTSLSVAYTGHHGLHELVSNPSANAFGFGSLPARPCSIPPVPPCADPRFGGVTDISSSAVSNYNAMVLSIQHRFTRWTEGQFQASYTYGHGFDEISNGGLIGFTRASGGPQDPRNLRDSYGPSDYDVRHSLNASYVWELPVRAALGRHIPDPLGRGWQISGTIFARTGFPYTVYDLGESFNLGQNNYFGLLYAVPVGPLGAGTSCGERAAYPPALQPCQPPQVLSDGITPNPGARFVQSGCETGFNAGTLPGTSGPCSGSVVNFAQGRNRFRGPSYFNTDLAIMKNTKIPGRENLHLGIGIQFFNLFNHPNFGFPDFFSSDQTLGQIEYLEQSPTSILGSGIGEDASPRMIQLKVQIQF